MGSAPHRTEISGDKVTISSSALSGGSKHLSPGRNLGPRLSRAFGQEPGWRPGLGCQWGLGQEGPTLTGVMSVITHREPR